MQPAAFPCCWYFRWSLISKSNNGAPSGAWNIFSLCTGDTVTWHYYDKKTNSNRYPWASEDVTMENCQYLIFMQTCRPVNGVVKLSSASCVLHAFFFFFFFRVYLRSACSNSILVTSLYWLPLEGRFGLPQKIMAQVTAASRCTSCHMGKKKPWTGVRLWAGRTKIRTRKETSQDLNKETLALFCRPLELLERRRGRGAGCEWRRRRPRCHKVKPRSLAEKKRGKINTATSGQWESESRAWHFSRRSVFEKSRRKQLQQGAV